MRAWNADEVVAAIENVWDRVLRSALSSYDSLRSVQSSADYRAALQDLTTVASVNAWKAGYWR